MIIFYIIDNSCCNEILLAIATYVVMTYWLLLHIVLLCDACWYDIPYHDIIPVVLTYYAMTNCLWKHSMLRHIASCCKISCYDIRDRVPGVSCDIICCYMLLWHSKCLLLRHPMICCIVCCCVMTSDIVPVATYDVNMT